MRWRVVSSPNFGNGNNYLYGSAALSPTNVWTVGWANNNGIGQTLILHWDGSSWTRFPSPNIGTNYNFLTEISALSANDIWAVGYAGDQQGGVARTLTTHWDGTSWNLVSSPNTPPSSNYLEGVIAVSTNDVWAAGHYYTGSVWRTLFLHWNGTSWSQVSSPNASGSDNFLYDVRAVSAGDIWADGWYDSGSGFRTLVLHWDGTVWNLIPSPNVGTNSNQLWKLATISTNDVWAAGHYTNSGGVYQTLTLHWDGTGWGVVPSANVGTSNNRFEVIAAASTNDVWASGRYLNGSVDQTLVEHWNGTAWSVIGSPNLGANLNTLEGSISILSPSDVWATGSYSHYGSARQTLVERYSNPCVPTLTPTLTPTSTTTPTYTSSPTRTSTPTSSPTHTNTPTITPTSTTTPCPMTFTDVGTSDYFYAAVNYLYCRGVVSGYGDNTFRPYNNTTRGQLTKIVVLGFGLTIYTPPAPTFRDVPASYPFYRYIETATHNNIVSGYGCGAGCLEFRPGNNVTRGQLSKIVVVAARWALRDPSRPTFQDVPVDHPFYTFVETAYCHGIINGYTCGTNCLEFRPGSNATRAQICKIVYQALVAGSVCP